MPIYTALDFAALHKTTVTLQQQQWAQTFSKPLATQHINEWRAFRDNTLYTSSATTASQGSTSPLGSVSSNPTSPRLAGLVGDAKTYAEAAKATRVLLDEDFHLYKMLKEEEGGGALLDWLRLFRADCLRELERFLSLHSTTDIPLKLKHLNADLKKLYEKRSALDGEIVEVEVALTALSEVNAGASSGR